MGVPIKVIVQIIKASKRMRCSGSSFSGGPQWLQRLRAKAQEGGPGLHEPGIGGGRAAVLLLKLPIIHLLNRVSFVGGMSSCEWQDYLIGLRHRRTPAAYAYNSNSQTAGLRRMRLCSSYGTHAATCLQSQKTMQHQLWSPWVSSHNTMAHE